MKEIIKKNILDFLTDPPDYPIAICVTTNGYVKRNGEAVMGRGVAYQISRALPNISHKLGEDINDRGNIVTEVTAVHSVSVVSFPVKHTREICRPGKDNVVSHMRYKYCPGDYVPGWACKADISLIQTSAFQLKDLADDRDWEKVYLPCPGCGTGELTWREVGPSVSRVLADDKFVICTL